MQLNDQRFTAHERELIDMIPTLTASLMRVLSHDDLPRRDVAHHIRNASQALESLAWSLKGEKHASSE